MNSEDRLHELCELVTSGQAQNDEVLELERLLESDLEARKVFLDWASLEVDLLNVTSARRSRQELLEPIQQHETREKIKDQLKWAFAIAASLLLSFYVGSWYSSLESNLASSPNSVQETTESEPLFFVPPIDGMAVINRLDSVEWTQGSQQFSEGVLLRGHHCIDISSGTAEVEFGQGAVVIVEGPARFSAKSISEGMLEYGKIAAVVPPWSQGFEIDTPGLEIVDRGTQFVVEVSANQEVNVGVTKGEVEILGQTDQDASERVEFKHSLLEGKAIRAAGGSLLETELDLGWGGLSDKLPIRPGNDEVEVVAKYRRDFVAGIGNEPRREGNWRYFANQWSAWDDTEGYAELRWDSHRKLYDPNGDFGRNSGTRLFAANLSYRGGHPGQGRDQVKDDTDHYVIAAYQVQHPGMYRLESGWLVRAESRADLPTQQSVDLRVRVNERPDAIYATCNRDGLLRFQGDLGQLKEGDWIYVAVGPQGVSFNDRFEWDFAIVRVIVPLSTI